MIVKMLSPKILMVFALTVATIPPAQASDTRCGWIVNPTPSNWWLDDKDASWEIMLQGGNPPPGMDHIDDISAHDYVKTNGIYGYACACLSGTFNTARKKVVRITGFQQKPLAVCKNDKALKPEE